MDIAARTPSREQLRSHLVDSRIAGVVATPRENNLDHYLRMSNREPLYLLGLQPQGAWTPADVLDLMVERCGVSPDPRHTHGHDTIDPQRTIERLEAMGDRIRTAAERGERVLVATGHPVGLRPIHTAVARALHTAGCTLLTAAEGWQHQRDHEVTTPPSRVRFLDHVGVLAGPGGGLDHTHSPLPMRAVLAELAATGQAPPDLVIADHGWAGAAAQAGIDVVGFADCNDPGLFVGEAEGLVQVCVPLDDNVDPTMYQPLSAYLLHHAGLA